MDTVSLNDVEISIILNDRGTVSNGSNELFVIYDLLVRGQYEEVLKQQRCQDLLRVEADTLQAIESTILQNVQSHLSSENNHARQLEVLAVGIACLQIFVQNNWSGPATYTHLTQYTCPECANIPETKALDEAALADLALDGMTAYSLTKQVLFLSIAKTILLECRALLTECQTADWWLLRCLRIHQHLLDDRSPTLKAASIELLETISKREPLMTSEKYRNAVIHFHLEASSLCFFYYEHSSFGDYFNSAKKASTVDINLTGALGRRTQFQTFDRAQMMLTTKRHDDAEQLLNEGSLLREDLPRDLLLNDDTVLNEIKVTGETPHMDKMTATEQALAMAMCTHHKRLHLGQGQLVVEETMAYITGVLSEPQNWAVQTSALLQRCQMESDSVRRMERSMTQLEELVNQYARSSPGAGDRLHLLYCTAWPPLWDIQRQHAELLEKIGIYGQALSVYEAIHMWESAIMCYQRLGKATQAEAVIRRQLAVKETPNLYCFLGDVTNNPEFYTKAWEMSNSRHARSMKCLGYYYLSKKEFEQSMSCFEKALNLNGLQIGIWFSYGCSAMAVAKYEIAAKAFRRCVNLDFDNFEAWNNLAASYIRLNQKPRAFSTLKDAVKCAFDNWRIWDNLLMVSIDVGEFAEAIFAYNRLLDMRDKHEDVEVLSILVRVVNEDIIDAHNQPASRLRQKTRELFGRLTSVVTNNAEIWRLYAKLLSGSEATSDEEKVKITQYLQKSHRSLTQSPNWFKTLDQTKKVAEQSVQLANAYMECSSTAGDPKKAAQMLTSGKLALKGVHTKIKQTHADPITGELASSLTPVYTELDAVLNEIVTKISQLNTQ